VAGAAVAKLGYTDFRDRLRHPSRDATEFAAKLARELPTGHAPQIAATLLDSIRRLSEDGFQFLQMAAILASAPIPMKLVEVAFCLLDENSEVGIDKAILGMESATLEALAEHTPGVDMTDDAISVHVLVNRTMRFHTGEPPLALREAVVLALTISMTEAGDVRKHPNLLPLLPHARVLTQQLPDVSTGSLLSWIGQFNLARGAYSEVESDNRRVFASSKSLLGEEDPVTLISMSNLAEALRAQGDYVSARSLQEEILKICIRTNGSKNTLTMYFMNNLAATLLLQGNYDRAQLLQAEALAISHCLLGSDHPTTLGIISNLAETLVSQKDYIGARALQQGALEIARSVLGDDHSNTLTLLGNLAETMRAEGDYADAEVLQREVLAVKRRLLGVEHPDTLTTMNNLAITMADQGNYVDVQPIIEEVLTVSSRVLGAEHPNTLASMNNLATIMWLQGNFAKARALHQEVLVIRRRVLGTEHPDTLSSISNLVEIAKAQDDHAALRTLEEERLAVHLRVLGAEHLDTLSSMSNLAVTLFHLGEIEEARALVTKALPMAIKQYEQEPELSHSLIENAIHLGVLPPRKEWLQT
jgi:tetratricopeptide (TPR) repeat protein